MRLLPARRARRQVCAVLGAAVLVAGLSGCAARDAVDSALGFPPTGREEPDGAALEPVAVMYPILGDQSAGWSPLAPSRRGPAGADLGTGSGDGGRYTVPPPGRPAAPVPPVLPDVPDSRLEPPVRPPGVRSGPRVERIELLPMRDCPSFNDGTRSVAMRVEPGVGSLTATFWFRNTPGLVDLLVGAEPQGAGTGAPAAVWVVVPPPATCQEVTLTLPGLATGLSYRVLVDERVESKVTGRTTRRTVGTSEGVIVG